MERLLHSKHLNLVNCKPQVAEIDEFYSKSIEHLVCTYPKPIGPLWHWCHLVILWASTSLTRTCERPVMAMEFLDLTGLIGTLAGEILKVHARNNY